MKVLDTALFFFTRFDSTAIKALKRQKEKRRDNNSVQMNADQR
jgi:hypothetical protein